eukprot:7011089-Alexandrium_andersonii.AAC.1
MLPFIPALTTPLGTERHRRRRGGANPERFTASTGVAYYASSVQQGRREPLGPPFASGPSAQSRFGPGCPHSFGLVTPEG